MTASGRFRARRLRPRAGRPAGVYLHLPVCRRRCPYCTYPVSIPDSPGAAFADYERAVEAELEAKRELLASLDVRVVYVGGGTPSYWPISGVERLVGRIRRAAQSPELPVALEANPEDVSPRRLDRWAALGVERLTVGLQSFDSGTLERLGRMHDADRGAEALDAASQADISAVGCDLVLGLPGDSRRRVDDDFARCVELADVDYVTGYELDERGASAIESEAGEEDSERRRDVAADQLERLARRARAAGLRRVELAAFARGGAASRMQTIYWGGGEYVGLGMGAHEHVFDDERGPVRRANPESWRAYLAAPADSAREELLDLEEYLVERVLLALKHRPGLHVPTLLGQLAGVDDRTAWKAVERRLVELERESMVRRSGEHWRPTERGLKFEQRVGRVLAEAPA